MEVVEKDETDLSTRKRKHDIESGEEVEANDDEIGKRKKLSRALELEKERLEKLVIGDRSYIIKNLKKAGHDSGLEDEPGPDSDYSDTLASPKEPAWEDDDDKISVEEAVPVIPLGTKPGDDYEKILRRKFHNLYGEPSWAKLGHKSEEDEILQRTAGGMLEKPTFLAKGLIDAKRLAFLNSETRNEGVIKSVEFHTKSAVALVAGLSGVASLFQVDGKGNNKLASIKFQKFPIRCAKFSADGNHFIVGSQHNSYFYSYDMLRGESIKIALHHNMEQTNMKKFEISPDNKIIAVAGRFGKIHLLTAQSKEWIGNLTMNGNVESITFNSDGSKLYSHGEQGQVYIWDVSKRSLIKRFYDDGCLLGTTIALSPDDKYMATGSSSGVVNLYDNSSMKETPFKSVMNLVTSISSIKFNNTSQIMAIASDDKENAVKLVHVESATVYSNFPTLNSDLARVQAVAFSPSSGYFACANNKSSAFLYRSIAQSQLSIATTSLDVIISEVLPVVHEGLDFLSQSENRMTLLQQPHEIDSDQLATQRLLSIRGLNKASSEVEIPDLESLDISPEITRNGIIDLYTNEARELELLNEITTENITNLKTTIKNCKQKEDNFHDIKQGLNQFMAESTTEKNETDISELKKLFSQMKSDLDKVLTICCPEIKEEVKEFLSLLEQEEKNGEEDGMTWLKPHEDLNLNVLHLLLDCNIIEKHPTENMFKFACLE